MNKLQLESEKGKEQKGLEKTAGTMRPCKHLPPFIKVDNEAGKIYCKRCGKICPHSGYVMIWKEVIFTPFLDYIKICNDFCGQKWDVINKCKKNESSE